MLYNLPVAFAADSAALGPLRRENAQLKHELDTAKKQLANKTIAEASIKGGDGMWCCFCLT